MREPIVFLEATMMDGRKIAIQVDEIIAMAEWQENREHTVIITRSRLSDSSEVSFIVVEESYDQIINSYGGYK